MAKNYRVDKFTGRVGSPILADEIVGGDDNKLPLNTFPLVLSPSVTGGNSILSTSQTGGLHISGWIDISSYSKIQISTAGYAFNSDIIQFANLVDGSYVPVLSVAGSCDLTHYVKTIKSYTRGVDLPNAQYLRVKCLGNSYFPTDAPYTNFSMTTSGYEADISKIIASIPQNSASAYKPRLLLTSVIYAVVGTQVNLYYDAIILAIDGGARSPSACSVSVTCNVGSATERNFQYTPISGDIGDHTMTITVYDSNKNVLQTKTAILRVLANNQPSSVKNILMVGDSTLNNGPVVPTIRDNFVALGSNTPLFFGGKGVSPTNHYGWPGATFETFATQGSSTYFAFNVSGVASISIGAVFSDNGSQFSVIEIYLNSGSGYIRCSRTSGTNNPQVNGSLTKVSGTGDSAIAFSSYTIDPANQFWNSTTNQLDIANYRSVIGMGSAKFDIVTFRLGVNESFGSLRSASAIQQTIDYAKSLIQAFLSDNASTKIILELPTTDGNTRGGWAANYGATMSKEVYQLNVWAIREMLISTFDNGAYNSNVEVCMSGIMVDRYYAYSLQSTQVASRITSTESWHINAVHPNNSGYQQLGDAIFPHILKFVQ